MNLSNRFRCCAAAASVACAALLPGVCSAQLAADATSSEGWRFGASIYGYLPSISGSSKFPVSSGGGSIDVPVDKIVDSLKFTFMGALDVHNGRWGGFTDVPYLNLGGDKQNSRDFSISKADIPADTTANLEWDFKGLIWTVAGEYRVAAGPGYAIDLLAGARMFDMKQELRWSFSGDIGTLPPAARSGSAEIEEKLWDGIVGVKGRVGFGDSGKWSVPFYLDVGTGDSDLTWQLAGGITYTFEWGELTAMWRYLDYELKNSAINDINFSGPMIGATWRF